MQGSNGIGTNNNINTLLAGANIPEERLRQLYAVLGGGVANNLQPFALDQSSLFNRNPSRQFPTPPTRVNDPVQTDVLLGRGKPFQSHRGNQRMLDLVDVHREPYFTAERKGKHVIVEKVIDIIHANGGRFLSRVDYQNFWVEVSHSIAYRKVGHAFRSKARAAEGKGPSESAREVAKEMEDIAAENKAIAAKKKLEKQEEDRKKTEEVAAARMAALKSSQETVLAAQMQGMSNMGRTLAQRLAPADAQQASKEGSAPNQSSAAPGSSITPSHLPPSPGEGVLSSATGHLSSPVSRGSGAGSGRTTSNTILGGSPHSSFLPTQQRSLLLGESMMGGGLQDQQRADLIARLLAGSSVPSASSSGGNATSSTEAAQLPGAASLSSSLLGGSLRGMVPGSGSGAAGATGTSMIDNAALYGQQARLNEMLLARHQQQQSQFTMSNNSFLMAAAAEEQFRLRRAAAIMEVQLAQQQQQQLSRTTAPISRGGGLLLTQNRGMPLSDSIGGISRKDQDISSSKEAAKEDHQSTGEEQTGGGREDASS